MKEIIVLSTHRLRPGDTVVQRGRTFTVDQIVQGSMDYRGSRASAYWITGTDTEPDRASTREIKIIAAGRSPWHVKTDTGQDS